MNYPASTWIEIDCTHSFLLESTVSDFQKAQSKYKLSSIPTGDCNIIKVPLLQISGHHVAKFYQNLSQLTLLNI